MNLSSKINKMFNKTLLAKFFRFETEGFFNFSPRLFSLAMILGGVIFYLLGKFFLWHPLSIFGFLIWLLGSLMLSALILRRYVKSFLNYSLGFLLVFYLLGLILSFFNVLIFLNYLTSALTLLLTGLILYFFSYYKSDSQKNIADNQLDSNDTLADDGVAKNFFISNKIALILEFLLGGILLLGFYQLFISMTESAVFNPWNFLSVFYALSGITGFFIISLLILVFKQKNRRLLFWLIALSFLVHGFLLVSSAGFNADRFRHLGSEYRLLNYFNEINPSIKSADWSKSVDVFGISVANPLLNINQFSYSFQWSQVVFFGDLLRLDLFFVDLYLGWIFWSVFTILIFYGIGLLVTGNHPGRAMIVPLVSLIFFQLLYYGGQTLPVAWGGIFFLFFIILILANLKNKTEGQDLFLLFLCLISLFSYTLSFVLCCLAYFLFCFKNKLWPFVVAMLSIFLLELFSAYSYFSIKLSSFYQQIFGSNIFSFVGDNFLFWQFGWLSVLYKLFFIFLCLLILLIMLKYLKSKSRTKEIDFIILFVLALVINFLLGVIFLQGTLISIRRLNLFISLLLVIFIGYWLIVANLKNFKLFLVFFLTLLFVLAWLSGPQTNIAVSLNDWRSAKFLASDIKNNYVDYCILADTSLLLPLEALTDREIAGGNFPIDANHGQPELNLLLKDLYQQKLTNVGSRSLQLSGKKKCWLVASENKLDHEFLTELKNLYGPGELLYGNYFWLIK